MLSVLNEAYFHEEAAAFEAFEAILWTNGPTCPHCGAPGPSESPSRLALFKEIKPEQIDPRRN